MTMRISAARCRNVAFSLFIACLYLGVAGPGAPTTTLAASSVTGVIPVDRQDYVSDLPQDPYATSNGGNPPSLVPDGTEVHVGVAAGTETSRGFFHLELDGVPQGATLTGGSVVFKTNAQDGSSNPQYDVNTSGSKLKACLLKAELAASFDPTNPPPYENAVCTSGKMTTEPAPGNLTRTVYTFDLAPLLAHWSTGSNTGAAIVPDSPAGTDSWAIGFDKTLSASVIDYLISATQPTYSTEVPAQTSYNVNPVPAAPPALGPYPANPPAVVQAPPAPKVAASEPNGPTAPAVSGQIGFPLWMLVLAGALGIAVALVGQPIAQALAAGGGLGGMLVPLRMHPRMFYMAGMLAVTSTTYGAYSVANGQGFVRGGQGGAVASSTPSAPPSAGASPSASAAPGSLAAVLPEHPVGTTERIGNTTLVVPAGGEPPVANLFSAADDTVGIDPKYINLCAHAALIFGPALHLGAGDLSVFWRNLNDNGPYWIHNAGYKGIYGRKVVDTYFDDQYAPGPAVQAAQNCKDQQNPSEQGPNGATGTQSDTNGTFFLEGGIGFDQIPAVRQWAETNHTLYYHHMATELGDSGLRYSFSYLPSVENAGAFLGQYAESNFHGHTFGVLWRNSTNWEGGSDAFKSYLESHGDKVPVYDPVNNNQGNYAKEIADLQAAHVDVALAWENALGTPEIIKQAQQQGYNPHWLVASFNIVPMTVGANATPPAMNGFGAWPAYNCKTYDGGFSPYAADIKEFEREYAQYDSSAYNNLCGSNAQGADLLYGAWVVDKQIAQMLIDCGPQCTRNKVAGLLLSGYKQNVPPNCPEDWSRKQRWGSWGLDITQMWQNPADSNWDLRPQITCAEHIP